MQKRYIVGNWKMAPTSRKEAVKTFQGIRKKATTLRKVNTIICPPHPYIHPLGQHQRGSRLTLGAQDVFWEKEGSHTGEVSPLMLSDLKVRTTIVGHSERRAKGETNEQVNKKVHAAVKEGLTAIVCVGEQSRDEEGDYTRIVAEELRASLEGIPKKHFTHIMIAYEPIWAIGKQASEAAAPEDVQEMVILIRKTLTDAFDRDTAEKAPILYGGSVNPHNTRRFLESGGVDGLLIGRASRDAKKMDSILDIAEEVGRSA